MVWSLEGDQPIKHCVHDVAPWGVIRFHIVLLHQWVEVSVEARLETEYPVAMLASPSVR